MLKRVKLSVRMSELHEQHISVPTWEVAILNAKYGTAVKVLGEELVNREPPDPAAEFERLQRRYGRLEDANGAKGHPYADAVYGQFGIGQAALAKAIAESVIEVSTNPDSPVEELV